MRYNTERIAGKEQAKTIGKIFFELYGCPAGTGGKQPSGKCLKNEKLAFRCAWIPAVW